MPPSIMTPELQAAVGKEGTSFTLEVEKGHVRRFAEAVRWPKTPNPLYTNDAYARSTRQGGVIAPPSFLTCLPRDLELISSVPCPKPRTVLNGGTIIENLLSIHPGDVLTGRTRIAALKEVPRGENEVMLIMSCETRCWNQRNEQVGSRTTNILLMVPVPAQGKEATV
ncbi:MAG: MaoC family dehydratase N-terminal domain-containing protein [Chloroflexi bacterium]|nr:MaoC family dehydratase N-terminal domain-containing protein [Chloroflexota bacterium]